MTDSLMAGLGVVLAEAAERTGGEPGAEQGEPLRVVELTRWMPVSAEQWGELRGGQLPAVRRLPWRTRLRWWAGGLRGRVGVAVGGLIAGYQLTRGDD